MPHFIHLNLVRSSVKTWIFEVTGATSGRPSVRQVGRCNCPKLKSHCHMPLPGAQRKLPNFQALRGLHRMRNIRIQFLKLIIYSSVVGVLLRRELQLWVSCLGSSGFCLMFMKYGRHWKGLLYHTPKTFLPSPLLQVECPGVTVI